jgi:hypothetical protein
MHQLGVNPHAVGVGVHAMNPMFATGLAVQVSAEFDRRLRVHAVDEGGSFSTTTTTLISNRARRGERCLDVDHNEPGNQRSRSIEDRVDEEADTLAHGFDDEGIELIIGA